MGVITGIIEGAIVVGGEQNYGFLTSNDYQRVILKTGMQNAASTGNNMTLYGDVISIPGGDNFPQDVENNGFSPIPNARFALTGVGSSIVAGEASHCASLEDNCDISLTYFEEPYDKLEREIKYCRVFTAGGESKILAENDWGVSDSLLISGGESGTISAGKACGCVALLAGDDSSIYIADNNIVMVTGHRCNITAGKGSTIFTSTIPEYITMEEGSVAALTWYDGVRSRIKVIYEGEDGIEAGCAYTISSDGMIKVAY